VTVTHGIYCTNFYLNKWLSGIGCLLRCLHNYNNVVLGFNPLYCHFFCHCQSARTTIDTLLIVTGSNAQSLRTGCPDIVTIIESITLDADANVNVNADIDINVDVDASASAVRFVMGRA
jgi:hypothetical protein